MYSYKHEPPGLKEQHAASTSRSKQNMLLRPCLPPLLLMTVVQYQALASPPPNRTCDTFTDLGLYHAIVGTHVSVRFLLHTRPDTACGRSLSHSAPLGPQFNLSRPTTFIIHGFRPTGSPPKWQGDLAEHLLAREDMNVVVVDWNRGATNIDYFRSVRNTREVAAKLTPFIRAMQEQGASLASIHMIGISLGAHISGSVGAKLNGKIGRITALDPAGPQFTGTSPKERLDPTDAQFVDVIHTDMDALGYRKSLGHIDFYANGGSDQTGCPKTILSGGAYFKCDHQRSVYLFLESLRQTCEIRAFPCSSYVDFLDGRCTDCKRFGGDGCPVFGYDVTEWKDTLVSLGQTNAYFTTNKESPFCKTNYRLDIVTWNQDVRWGYITVKLRGGGEDATATITHKASRFQRYTEARLLAQFDSDLRSVENLTVEFSTGNVLQPRYKLRVLRLRLTRLQRPDRPLCRYDFLLLENKETTFRPIPCEESNF